MNEPHNQRTTPLRRARAEQVANAVAAYGVDALRIRHLDLFWAYEEAFDGFDALREIRRALDDAATLGLVRIECSEDNELVVRMPETLSDDG